MAVYYKFKSAKDFNSIPIDGHFISVANLKEKIFESKQLGRGTDFDLMVANAQTNEEYIDEATLIPKNTSVLVRRVPGRPRMNIVAEPQVEKAIENKVEDTQLTKTSFPMADSSARIPEENEWDEFGNDLYAIPEVLPAQTNNVVQDFPPPSRADEDNKIKALVDSTALEWQRQTQEGFGAGRGYGRGMGGRMMGPARGFGRGVGGMEWKTPPPGYICFRCKVPGHFIQHCPTNGDPTYDIKRVKPPTGIPKSMLMTTPDGSYALPSGAVAVLKPNEAAFEKEIEGLPSTRTVNDLPPELRCPLCREVMKDAVLTSKCCFKSYCDKCIRDHIISKLMCVCGATNVLADDLLPNRTVRETINRILESNNSSAENGGSMLQIQDMASARSGPPKIPSPAASAASKGGQVMSPVKRNDREEETSAKVQFDTPLPQVPLQPLDKGKATKLADTAEAMDESMNVKEHIAQGSAPTAEKVMQKLPASEPVKKKKKKKAPFPVTGADLQWRGPQDLVAENYMMPYGPSGGNPYWGGMQLGMEGYMGGPFMGNMPYMGYVPGPFDMPLGGFMPQDHFGGQGYMMPVVQQQRDLAQFAMPPNHGHPIMSREEFEARKAAEVRRKNEMEQRREREYLKDRESGREISSSSRDLSSSMKSNSYRPEIKSQSSDQQHHSYHHQRQHRSESERVAPPPPLQPPREAESVRLGKRRPEIDEEDGMSAADKKHKRSVFARISFSEGKKKPSTTGGAAITGHSNGYKEYEPPASSGHHKSSHHHHHHRRHDREEVKPAVGVGGGGGSRRREVDSSDDDEDDDDDRHFKRKPSRYNPPPQSVEEEDDDDGIRSSRRSRERDHHHERHRKHR